MCVRLLKVYNRMKNNKTFLFLSSLISPQFASTALKVALIVGSILFVINHGDALLQR